MKNDSVINSGSGRLSYTFVVLTVMFCICLVTANLLEFKVVALGPVTITAGLAVFPISYVINDCIVEVYGFARARFVIWLGFAVNLFFSLFLQLGIWMPAADGWGDQASMEAVFGAVPRILTASFLAFLCGSFMNAHVMEKMKRKGDNSMKSFSLRAIVSTVWGEGVDSVVFFPLAFAGTLPVDIIVKLILTQTALKSLYELIILPVTMVAVNRLRVVEGGV